MQSRLIKSSLFFVTIFLTSFFVQTDKASASVPSTVAAYVSLVCESSILNEIEPYIFLDRHIEHGIVPPNQADQKRKEMNASWNKTESKHKTLLTNLGLKKGKAHPLKIQDMAGKDFNLHIKAAMKVRMKKCLTKPDQEKWKLSDLSSAIHFLMEHLSR